jgi:aldose 1-epimerase
MMGVGKSAFGELEGQIVEAFEIDSGPLRATIISYGAALTQLYVPEREGRLDDIVLGYDNLQAYLQYRGSAGAICGRYANRIAGAKLMLDGRNFALSANEPPHHLHGGFSGFSKRLWMAEPDPAGNAVRLTLTRPDGDEGYPGMVNASVIYRLLDEPALEIIMEATTDRPTVVNMAYHGYWNLAGHGSGDIRNQRLQIDASHYTPVDPDKIPIGEIAAVDGTVFDFRAEQPLGSMLEAISQLGGVGYDHNFCLSGEGQPLRRAARATDPRSGREMEIWTNQPGVQLYTANHLEKAPAIGKGGVVYGKHAGFALETQNYPNAPNIPHFPSAMLRPGETYRHVMRVPFFTT